jgi:hypothetical protein
VSAQLLALLPWVVVLLAVWAVVQLGVAAHRAARAGTAGGVTPVGRVRLLARVLGSLTFLLLALALGPWGPVTWPLWSALLAVWAWGALTAGTAWRHLPRRAAGERGRGVADLVGEAGLLVAVIAFVVV